MKDYYRLLEVKTTATQDEIDAAYERLLDWQENFPESFVLKQKEIDQAYDTLSDPKRRTEYDYVRSYRTQHVTFSSIIDRLLKRNILAIILVLL